LAERFLKEKDHGALIAVLEDQVKALKQAPNPWLLVDLAWLRASQPAIFRDKTAGEMYQQALVCARAAALVPSAPRYNRDRASILWAAAAIAVKAATLDHGFASWRDTYHPFAAYAVRAYAFSDQYKVIDIGGYAREPRMVALALAGQSEKALRLGQEMRDIRNNSPTYHFYMARLWAMQGKKPELLAHAEQAQNIGLGTLLPKCTEVAGLLVDKKFKADFESRTKPKVVAWVTLKPGKDKSMVSIQNISPFKLTNARASLAITTNGGKTEYPLEIPLLAKDQKTIREFIPPAAVIRGAVLSIESDQGSVPWQALGNKQ
jgi:hypothetical protein